jgi:hypothetical protein
MLLLRHHEEVLLELAARGHQVEVALPRANGRAMRGALADAPDIAEFFFDERPDDERARSLRALRLFRDYLRFLEPPLDTAFVNRARVLEELKETLAIDDEWSGELPPGIAAVRDALAHVESLVPPDPAVEQFIRERAPDIVLVTPLVSLGANQIEIVKASRALGIPCALPVFSWDNLSNKGLIGVVPDRVFVWNELQAREAVELHGVPRDSVVVTGAPRFDRFFEMTATQTRDELYAAHGFDPSSSLVVYLGSAPLTSPDERIVADRWLAAVRRTGDPRLREANVLVRPHPRQRGLWEEWGATSDPRVAVSGPTFLQADQGLYDQLFHADAVVGLNTSAEIEASILGKPVLTFAAGDDAPGQRGTTHFEYLLDRNGGVVQYAEDLDDHVAQLARAVNGDYDEAAVRSFVEWFVRPRGIDQPVVPVFADELVQWADDSARGPA